MACESRRHVRGYSASLTTAPRTSLNRDIRTHKLLFVLLVCIHTGFGRRFMLVQHVQINEPQASLVGLVEHSASVSAKCRYPGVPQRRLSPKYCVMEMQAHRTVAKYFYILTMAIPSYRWDTS
jgi:hypothetical protein